MQSSGLLKFKLQLVQHIAREARAKGDPRWENCIPQEEELNRLIGEAERRERQDAGAPAPPAIVVQVKSAVVGANKRR